MYVSEQAVGPVTCAIPKRRSAQAGSKGSKAVVDLLGTSYRACGLFVRAHRMKPASGERDNTLPAGFCVG